MAAGVSPFFLKNTENYQNTFRLNNNSFLDLFCRSKTLTLSHSLQMETNLNGPIAFCIIELQIIKNVFITMGKDDPRVAKKKC